MLRAGCLINLICQNLILMFLRFVLVFYTLGTYLDCFLMYLGFNLRIIYLRNAQYCFLLHVQLIFMIRTSCFHIKLLKFFKVGRVNEVYSLIGRITVKWLLEYSYGFNIMLKLCDKI